MSDEILPPESSTPPPPPPEAPPAMKDNSWALLIHLSPLLCLFGGTFPGLSIIGPLVLWLIKRADSAYLDEVGKRVLNFQISWMIYFVIAWASFFVLIGFILLPVVAIAWLVYTIIGAVRESNREPYRFPLTIQFLK
ncbi:MAG: DUF4870 domain-containing protein [Chthoniobacterales bacterium]